MKLLLLGDVHGNWPQLNKTLHKAFNKHPDITEVIQVGDFGYAWPGTNPHKFEKNLDIKDKKFWWLDGNHENFTRLQLDWGITQPNWEYQKRGSIKDFGKFGTAMFFGGATSIDKHTRTPGFSWWADENISYMQIWNAMNSEYSPDIMFTHDAPANCGFQGKGYKINKDSNRNALEELNNHFQPKWWFFGHHHDADWGTSQNGMQWFCCPIIDSGLYYIFDGNEVTRSW